MIRISSLTLTFLISQCNLPTFTPGEGTLPDGKNGIKSSSLANGTADEATQTSASLVYQALKKANVSENVLQKFSDHVKKTYFIKELGLTEGDNCSIGPQILADSVDILGQTSPELVQQATSGAMRLLLKENQKTLPESCKKQVNLTEYANSMLDKMEEKFKGSTASLDNELRVKLRAQVLTETIATCQQESSSVDCDAITQPIFSKFQTISTEFAPDQIIKTMADIMTQGGSLDANLAITKAMQFSQMAMQNTSFAADKQKEIFSFLSTRADQLPTSDDIKNIATKTAQLTDLKDIQKNIEAALRMHPMMKEPKNIDCSSRKGPAFFPGCICPSDSSACSTDTCFNLQKDACTTLTQCSWNATWGEKAAFCEGKFSTNSQSMPSGMKKMPDGMQGMPDGMKKMPDGMQGMPDGMKKMPDGMQGIPDGMKPPMPGQGTPNTTQPPLSNEDLERLRNNSTNSSADPSQNPTGNPTTLPDYDTSDPTNTDMPTPFQQGFTGSMPGQNPDQTQDGTEENY